MTTRHLLLTLLASTGACGSDPAGAPAPDGGAAPPDAAPAVADADDSFTPSNVGVVGALTANGMTVGASGDFDTTADCTAPSLLGACEPVAGGLGPDLCVCRADDITLGDLTIRGERGLVLLAWNQIAVNGSVVLHAEAGVQGPGARRVYAEGTADRVGGAGGSHGGGGAGDSRPTFGDATLVPLEGGMRGQDTCQVPGGGGGGALQLTAGTRVLVIGSINAGGGGGQGGAAIPYGGCGGGAGGGSGGAVLLEAPAVQVSGTVAANGGGGGGGGGNYSGGPGAGGRTGDEPAGGGTGDSGWGCALNGYTSGGWGGAGAAAADQAMAGGPMDSISGCLNGTEWLGEGGSGGGVGRIRINTRSGCVCDGLFSPAPSFGAAGP